MRSTHPCRHSRIKIVGLLYPAVRRDCLPAPLLVRMGLGNLSLKLMHSSRLPKHLHTAQRSMSGRSRWRIQRPIHTY